MIISKEKCKKYVEENEPRVAMTRLFACLAPLHLAWLDFGLFGPSWLQSLKTPCGIVALLIGKSL
jgi:hypothetical protein